MNIKRVLRVTLKLITLPFALPFMIFMFIIGNVYIFTDWLNENPENKYYSNTDISRDIQKDHKEYLKNILK